MNSRRKVLAGLAALGAGAWLRAGHAQRMHRVAVLINGTESAYSGRLGALRGGLKVLGYTEGRNLALSVRWSEAVLERLPDLAAELLRENPDVVVCAPVLAAAAVHKHSRAVPIVMASGDGAVKIGLAKSFARPGGNVTGLQNQNDDLTAKHIEFLKVIVPGVTRLAILNTGKYLFHDEAWRAATQAAQALKLTLVDVRVAGPGDLSRLASSCAKGGCNALYVMPDPSLITWRAQIVEQAARLRLPAVYYQSEFVQDGGLMSYSANIEDMYRRAADFVDRILKGAKPGDLPIERPTKFELVINLKTAKALGLTIPGDMLARADRIIR
jgi:putative ABC transport system substrate-binding protein